MNRLQALFTATGARESALIALTLVVIGLLALALVFSVLVLALRVRHELRRRRWAGLVERWEEAVLLALEDAEEVRRVHARVDRKHRLHFVGFTLEYVRRVRGEGRARLYGMVEPYLEPVAQRSRHRDVGVRARAVVTLGTLGLPRYSGPLVAALSDRSDVVAMLAARALASSGSPRSAAAVLAHLHRFRGWSPRFLSAMLAPMASEASEQLRKVLSDGGEAPWVRAVVADALRLRLDLASADIAATVIVTESDRELVAAGLRVLAAVGRPVHFTPARSRAESADDLIRAEALSALATVGGADEDAALLARGLSDASSWVGLHAARGLRAMGRRAMLVELAASHDSGAVIAAQVLDEEAWAHE